MATVFNPDTADNNRMYRGQYERKLYISSIPDGIFFDISQYVTKVSVNYAMNMSSEIAFEIVDKNLTMSKNNYFILGRDVIYETQTLGQVNSYTGKLTPIRQIFEIAEVNVSQGSGQSVIYSIRCYTKAIQQMKRDKNPASVKGNGTAFVREAARKYGLKFYGQETSKKKTINKAGGSKQAESLWTVLENLAADAKFVLFEVDGFLVFASEKFLLKKWGTDFRYDTKTVTDPKTKKKTPKKVLNRFIPLQFPNTGDGYVGTPGYFKLVEHPSIRKSANDPYAADGSCSVERINGTQIRPGMTAYVGTIPNMSGFYLVESVSFTEMTGDAVAVTFRTIERDEEKDKIKLLPLGERYQSVFNASEPITVTTVKQAAKDANGRKVTSANPDKRIISPNIATAENRFIYPIMPRANISKTYGSFASFKIASTNDENKLIITGNIDLWERPIFPIFNKSGTKKVGYQTLGAITHTVMVGSEYRSIILPTIYTEGGQAVVKTAAQVIAKYEADGGYSGFAKHLGVVAGSTKNAAQLNARDYAWLLLTQQQIIVRQRFPNLTLDTVSNTPGSANSQWS